MIYIIINDEEEYFVDLKYKDIKTNYYQISNYGNIRIKSTGYTMKDFISNRGYRRIGLVLQNGKLKKFSKHILVAATCCDNDDKIKNQVNHLDGDKDHNYYKNLEWVSQNENIQHAYDTGLMKKGKDHHLGKNDDSLIHRICIHLSLHHEMYDIVSDITNKPNIQRDSKEYQRWRAYVKKLRQRNFRKDIVNQYDF